MSRCIIPQPWGRRNAAITINIQTAVRLANVSVWVNNAVDDDDDDYEVRDPN